MQRLPLLLGLVVLGGAALSTALYVRLDRAKQLLEDQLAGATARSVKLETDLTAANEQNGTLKASLAATGIDLAAAKEKQAASEGRAKGLERDLAQTRRVMAVYEETARGLADDVAALKADLADTRATFASPDTVEAYKSTITDLERQLAEAHKGAAAPAVAGAPTAVFSSRPGRATVLTVGPSNAFVVLNFGSARGAQIGQRLTISQGAETVATLQISDVRTNFSVAQVQPDTLRGVLQKGDLALFIR